MTEELPEQRPEGKLIQEALKTDGRSVRQVAPLARLSEARWRQLVKGQLKVSRGVVLEQIAPTFTLARMASVLGVTPTQLVEAGRPDAAEALERLRAIAREVPLYEPNLPSTPEPATSSDEIELIYASKTMTPQEKLNAIRVVLRLRAELEAEAPAAQDGVTPHQAGTDQQPANNGH